MPAQPVPVAPPSLDRRAMNTALVLILIGGPIVVLDLTISEGGGRPVDIVNDTIGLGLLLWAVALLGRQPGPGVYQSRMTLVVILTAVMLVWSVVLQLSPEAGASPVALIFTGLSVLGTILFCSAMRVLSVAHGFHASAESWWKALLAVAILLGGGWIVSVLLSLVINPVTSATTVGVYAPPVDIESAAILVFLVALALLLIPLVFILIAIGTTRRELRAS